MSSSFFSDMNYSMANEDTSLEFEMVKQLKPRKILSVCGSGGRALPLICAGASELICVDLAKEQLLLLELRQKAVQLFSREDYSIFWGYAPYYQKRYTEKRQELFESLKLSDDCYHYFKDQLVQKKYEAFLFRGKWESTFVKFSKVAAMVLGKNIEKMFSFNDLEQQVKYFNEEFPWRRWNMILQTIGNKFVFNVLLYKGHFVKKNVTDSYFEYYDKAFKNLFYNDLLKKSFFAQLCLLGEINFEEGNTVEVNPECYKLMKKALSSKIKIRVERGDLIDTIKKYKDLDFISMSDVPSYFSGDVEKNFLQEIRPHLSKKGLVVIRSYLRIPNANRAGFTNVTKKYEDLINLEKVQMYRIEVLQNA